MLAQADMSGAILAGAVCRGVLANLDRRLFAELSHSAGPQTVKVSLSDAGWSKWRRYCDVLGLTMGEGIAALIDRELSWVVDHGVDRDSAELAIRAGELRGRFSVFNKARFPLGGATYPDPSIRVAILPWFRAPVS